MHHVHVSVLMAEVAISRSQLSASICNPIIWSEYGFYFGLM